MINLNVNEIYSEILADVKSRVPVSFAKSSNKSFDEVLNDAINESLKSETMNISGTDSINETEIPFISELKKSNPIVGSSIEEAIKAAAEKYGIDESLIKAVIRQESSFDANAVSKSGAVGLMQLMPATAKSLGVADSYDVEQNVDGGTKYLSQLLKEFNGDTSLALAAYNAGPNAVKKYDGIPPYEETQNYVPKVLEYQKQYIMSQYQKNK